MSRTLQIIELVINIMENEHGRYKLEVTSKGLCVADYKGLHEERSEMAQYYMHFYETDEEYQIECNKMFDEFIGGLKA